MPEVSILVKAKDEASNVLKGIGGSVGQMGGAFINLAKLGPAAALGAIAAGAMKLAYDAAQLEPTRITFENLAKSIDTTSESLLERLRPATMGMVDSAGLMRAANKLMAMGLAETEEEAADLAEMATKLGMAMGKGPTEAMEEFALMLANQSIPRLDTFGISAGKVRQRIEELMKADQSLTREQAFMTATMEQGQIAMDKVGDISDTTAVKMAQFSTKVADLKLAIGTGLIPVLSTGIDIITAFFDSIVNADKKAEELTTTLYESSDSAEEFALKVAGMRDKASGADWTLEQLTKSEAYLAAMTEYTARKIAEESAAQEAADTARRDAVKGIHAETEAIAELSEEVANATVAMEISQASQILDIRDAVEAYDELKNKVISAYADTSGTTYDYQQEMTRTEEDNLVKREDLLAKHAEKRAWVASGDWERSKTQQDEAHGYWEGILNQELADFDAGVTEKATRREEDYNHEIEVANRAAGERAAIAKAAREAELAEMRKAQTDRVILYALEILEHKGLLKGLSTAYGDVGISAEDAFALIKAGIIPVSGSLLTDIGGALTGLQGDWDDWGMTGKANMDDVNALAATIFPNIFNLGDKALQGIATSADTYIVQAGDTLGALATKWGTTVGEIVAANDILDANMITVGEIIKKPFDDAALQVDGLKSNVEDLGPVIWTAGDQFWLPPTFQEAKTDVEDLEAQIGETGEAVMKKMPSIEGSIRKGMEDPVEDAIDDLEDYRKELEDLDGTKVHVYVYTHYIDVGATPGTTGPVP